MINTSYPTPDAALAALGSYIMTNGEVRPARDGHETKEIGPVSFTIQRPLQRHLLNAGRKASLAAQIVETAWVLSGRNDIEALLPYLPRAKDFSDDGKTWSGGYGKRIRSWDGRVDQLAEVVDTLCANPESRRAVISIYDPATDHNQALKDVPCNDTLHFIKDPVSGALNLNVFTRSNDLIWGWSGINQFEWSVLLEAVADFTGMEVGRVSYNVSSLHVYSRHYNRMEQIISSGVRESPDFRAGAEGLFERMEDLADLDRALNHFWEWEEDIRHGRAGIREEIEELHHSSGMAGLRNWLKVLYAYWNPEEGELLEDHWPELRNTDLAAAYAVSVKRHKETPEPSPRESCLRGAGVVTLASMQGFVNDVAQLHEDKHAAYGDSWMRRGEQISILANIARKVDRLGVDGGGDTALDTAEDLAVYLAKYRLWLVPNRGHRMPDGSKCDLDPAVLLTGEDHPSYVKGTLRRWATLLVPGPDNTAPRTEAHLDDLINNMEKLIPPLFEELEREVQTVDATRHLKTSVNELGAMATALAYALWRKEQIAEWKRGNETRSWKGYGDA